MIIKSEFEIKEVLEWIEKQDIVAFDVETTGLNVRKDSIIGFGISNAEESYYIAHKFWDGNQLVEVVSVECCVNILNALIGKKLIAWNSSFDLRFTDNYFGVDLIDSLWSEGMLVKHQVDENRPFPLKQVAKKLFGEEATDEQTAMKESIKANGGSDKEYYKADLDIMAKYCEQDCKLTYRIVEHYMEILNKEGLNDLFFNKETMPQYKFVTIPMEKEGVLLDIPSLEKAQFELLADITTLTAEIHDEIKPLLVDYEKWFLWKHFSAEQHPNLFKQALVEYAKLDLPKTDSGKYSITKKTVSKLSESKYKDYLLNGSYLSSETIGSIQEKMFLKTGEKYMFNLASKDDLKKLFFETLEESPVSRTKLGAPQVDKIFLLKMSEKYDWVKKLLVYNSLNKIEGTYIGKWLREHEDGTFYPYWSQHGTVTGRYAGDLMQLSKKIDEGDPLVIKYTNMLRYFIIAGPGHKLVGADYSALEVVVFADDAGDESLLDMIRHDRDFYSQVVIDVFDLGDKYSSDRSADNFLKKLDPNLRQNAKSYSLGIRYGMLGFALSKTLNIHQIDAETIIDDYFKAYPGLKVRMDSLRSFAKENGYVVNKTGRVRHLPLFKSLSDTWGDELLDGLKLWQKYNDNPKKYASIKYLSRQYRDMLKQCYNFPIQSMAASIVNRASIALVREFKRVSLDAKIIMNIHDELVVRCKEKDAKRVAKIMQYIMENTTKLSVPLVAIPQIGDKYGEIK